MSRLALALALATGCGVDGYPDRGAAPAACYPVAVECGATECDSCCYDGEDCWMECTDGWVHAYEGWTEAEDAADAVVEHCS